MKFEIETNEWCEGCTMMEATESIIYAFNRPMVTRRYCKHLYVCKNAVELSKKCTLSDPKKVI